MGLILALQGDYYGIDADYRFNRGTGGYCARNAALATMNEISAFDKVSLKASNIGEMILKLTPFELGYLAGLLAENHPMMAREFAIAINLNLEEIYGNDYK
jgi:hypothetical protein